MACMTHECVACPWSACNNVARYTACPACGERVVSTFDEEPDRDDYDDSDEPEDEEDGA